MKNLILGLAFGLVAFQAMAADLSCQKVIYNGGTTWIGDSYTSQFPRKIIHMSMTFNQDVSEMTVLDSVDQKKLTIPVSVTCINSGEFTLKDDLPEDGPGHMQFTGEFINNNDLNFVGTKTLNGDPNIYRIGGTLVKN